MQYDEVDDVTRTQLIGSTVSYCLALSILPPLVPIGRAFARVIPPHKVGGKL
jgi:hypothetical protein